MARRKPFREDLRRLVGASDGDLVFEPFKWDGKNSEASRYNAGTLLQARIRDLERNAQDYCLIGHSHGGSVICHSLLQAAYERQELRHLRRWISIGTPFVETRKRFLLFSRLNDFAGAAYLIFAYLLIAYVAFLISLVRSGSDNPRFDALIVPLGAMLLLGIYAGLHRFQPEKLRILRRGRTAELQQGIFSRWLALRHKDDEAIHGLRLVRNIRLSPFDRTFAVPTLGFASLFLLPVVMYVLSQLVDYNALVGHIQEWTNFTPTRNADGFEEFARHTLAVFAYPSGFLFDGLKYFQITRTGDAFVDGFVLACVLSVGIMIGFAVLWVCGLVFRRLVMGAGHLFSHGLSVALNWATREQLKRLSYGSDTIGERAVAADQRPHWTGSINQALPDALSDEIAQVSDIEAAKSIRKLRAALGSFAFSDEERTVGNVIEDYLTWRELIHTNYFEYRDFASCSPTPSVKQRASGRCRNSQAIQTMRWWPCGMPT